MTAKIEIKGPIISNDEQWIYDLFDMDATSPRKVTDGLAELNGENVVVAINSPGGYVDDGSEIYTELKNYPGHVEIQIVGVAASAASFIALAGDVVKISPTGQIMIHNASMWKFGDHEGMEKASQILRVTDKSIVNAYMLKTGKTEQELLDMMAKETWMGAQDAVENGFADEIMFTDGSVKLAASATSADMIPQKVIAGIRNKMANKNKGKPPENKLENELSTLKNEIENLKKQIVKEPDPKPSQSRNLVKLFLNLR